MELRKICFGIALAALALSPIAVTAANITLLPSSPVISEPSQIQGTLNTLIAQENLQVSGLVSSLGVATATTGTSANTMLSYTLPANGLLSGQGLRMSIWGFNPADANVRTVTFNFGTAAATVLVTGSGALWHAECIVTNTGTVATPVQAIEAWGQQAATLVTSSQPASTQAISTTAMTVTIQLTTATSGITTANGAYIEQVK